MGGYALEKVEGFTIDAAGAGSAVTDNDGVNGSNGETLFWSIGKMEQQGTVPGAAVLLADRRPVLTEQVAVSRLKDQRCLVADGEILRTLKNSTHRHAARLDLDPRLRTQLFDEFDGARQAPCPGLRLADVFGPDAERQ